MNVEKLKAVCDLIDKTIKAKQASIDRLKNFTRSSVNDDRQFASVLQANILELSVDELKKILADLKECL